MRLFFKIKQFLFNDKYATKPVAIFILFLTTFFTAVSQVLFKISSSFIKEGFLKFFLSTPFIIGISLYALCYLSYLVALKYGELSVINPMLALTSIYSIIFSYFILHEYISRLRFISIVIILFGVILITRPVVEK